MDNTDRMIELIKEAYIEVMGEAKWHSLTDTQKHAVIMSIANGALRLI